jgi:hypothetical protein
MIFGRAFVEFLSHQRHESAARIEHAISEVKGACSDKCVCLVKVVQPYCFKLSTNLLIPSTISYIESHAKNPLIYPWLYTYVFIFQIPKIFMVLLLSVNLAHLVCSASCIKKSSNIHAPGKLFPEQRNLTCNDTCFPVFVEVTYAIIVKKPLVVACRKTKRVSGIAGYEMPLFPLSKQPVIKCKSTHKPRIVKPVSVAVGETKPGTLKARMLPIVVDCVLRSK